MTMNKNKSQAWTTMLFVITLLVSPLAANKINGDEECKRFVTERKDKSKALKDINVQEVLCTNINHHNDKEYENVFEIRADQKKFVLYQNLKNEENQTKLEYMAQSGLGVNYELFDSEGDYNTYLADVSGHELIKPEDWEHKTPELEDMLLNIIKKTKDTKDAAMYDYPTQFSSAYYNPQTKDIQFFQVWSFQSSDSFTEFNNFLEAFIAQFKLEEKEGNEELADKVDQIKDQIFNGIKNQASPTEVKIKENEEPTFTNPINDALPILKNPINDALPILKNPINDALPALKNRPDNALPKDLNLVNKEGIQLQNPLALKNEIDHTKMNLDMMKELYKQQKNKTDLALVHPPQINENIHSKIAKDLSLDDINAQHKQKLNIQPEVEKNLLLNPANIQHEEGDPMKLALVQANKNAQDDSQNKLHLDFDAEHLQKLMGDKTKDEFVEKLLRSQQKAFLNKDQKGGQLIDINQNKNRLALPYNEQADESINNPLIENDKSAQMELYANQNKLPDVRNELRFNNKNLEFGAGEEMLQLKDSERSTLPVLKIDAEHQNDIKKLDQVDKNVALNKNKVLDGMDVKQSQGLQSIKADSNELTKSNQQQENQPLINGKPQNPQHITGIQSDQKAALPESQRENQNTEVVASHIKPESIKSGSSDIKSSVKSNINGSGKNNVSPKKIDLKKGGPQNKSSYAIILVVSVIVLAILSIFCIVVLDKRISRAHDIEQGVIA